jgi:hypothetical protein
MPRRTTTYAIRLAVEGGGQVKAELVSVGQSGEQSLKRIESAGDRASGGLKGLGRQAELLRTGIRTLGGALIGVTTVGGLTALVDRSISAANAIGKTADTIGVGVEALQELRFAAKASGVEQQTLDMALQRFTRRAAEAAQGTGEAKDALAQMGIALRDQSGNLRSSEDLLGDVADAFVRIEDPAERLRLAFKLFDSEGVALVNLLRGGSDALDEMRERARDLGIVLDEHLVRDAGRARDELDTLAQGISALAAGGAWGSTITISWVRQTRVGGADWADGWAVPPLAEDEEEYELELLNLDGEVARTETGLISSSFSYTAVMQAADGEDVTTVRACQISAQVGRGFPATLDLRTVNVIVEVGESIAEGQSGSGTSNFAGNDIFAPALRRHGRPCALALRLPWQRGERQHDHGPVRRRRERARRPDRRDRGESVFLDLLRSLGGARVRLAPGHQPRQVLDRLP